MTKAQIRKLIKQHDLAIESGEYKVIANCYTADTGYPDDRQIDYFRVTKYWGKQHWEVINFTTFDELYEFMRQYDLRYWHIYAPS